MAEAAGHDPRPDDEGCGVGSQRDGVRGTDFHSGDDPGFVGGAAGGDPLCCSPVCN